MILPIKAVWLRIIGNEVQVLVEIDGTWYHVISEQADGSYSHIAEISNWNLDKFHADQ